MKKDKMILPDGSPAPLVELDEMNDVHAEELDLIHQLLKALEHDGGKQAMPLAETWLKHTEEHFDNEKRLMNEYDFPPMPMHVAEHEEVLSQMREQVQAFLEERVSTTEFSTWVHQTWTPWFIQHVNSMDMVTASFIFEQKKHIS